MCRPLLLHGFNALRSLASVSARIAIRAMLLLINMLVSTLLQSDPTYPLTPQRRAYSCRTLEIGNAQLAPAACMRGQACPFAEETEGECANQCYFVAGCRAFIHTKAKCAAYGHSCVSGLCYLHDGTTALTQEGVSHWSAAHRIRRCTVEDGVEVACHPTLSSNSSLTLVLVMKFETRNLRSWLLYHVQLGVRHFVIISN